MKKTTKEKVKSKARINAGKKKATGLQKWLQACKAAKEELKKTRMPSYASSDEKHILHDSNQTNLREHGAFYYTNVTKEY